MYQLSDYCVESFVHIECYSDCSRRGAIWLNPLGMVLFNVCIAVTSPVYLQLLRGVIWAL